MSLPSLLSLTQTQLRRYPAHHLLIMPSQDEQDLVLLVYSCLTQAQEGSALTAIYNDQPGMFGRWVRK